MTTKEEFEKRIEEARGLGIYETLLQIAKEQAEAGMFREAIQTIERTVNLWGGCDGSGTIYTIGEIVKIAGDNGVDVSEEALGIARKMKCGGCRGSALSGIALGMTHLDNPLVLEKALEIARKLGGRYLDSTLNYRAILQTKRGLFKEALETARTIKDTDLRADALTSIASEQANGGMDATSALDEALKSAPEIARRLVEVLKLQKAKEGEFQRPDFKKPISGQPPAEKATGRK
ncbi:MAG: hypothetical protein WC350_00325 [Candidatus Micrarchaeia archaeon]